MNYLFCRPFLFDCFNFPNTCNGLPAPKYLYYFGLKGMHFVFCRYDIESTRNVSGITIIALKKTQQKEITLVYLPPNTCITLVYLSPNTCINMVYLPSNTCITLVYLPPNTCITLVYLPPNTVITLVYLPPNTCITLVYLPPNTCITLV